MNTEDFDRVTAGTRMNEQSIAMARAYMVNSASTYAEVAEQFNVSRQRVAQAVSTVHSAQRRQAEIPEDFERLTLFVPRSAVRKIRALARDLGASRQYG